MSMNQYTLLAVIAVALTSALYKAVSLYVTSRQAKTRFATAPYIKGKLELGPADLCFPVRYAGSAHFNNPFTFLPWEGQGALVLNDTDYTYFGQSQSGHDLQLEFDRNNCLLVYIDKVLLRDGGLSWFSLEADDGVRHYFCTNGKVPDLTSTFSTTALYEKMTEKYSNL